jgi:hypothetical protein
LGAAPAAAADAFLVLLAAEIAFSGPLSAYGEACQIRCLSNFRVKYDTQIVHVRSNVCPNSGVRRRSSKSDQMSQRGDTEAQQWVWFWHAPTVWAP